jgi:three-Cys-motif partner protein
VTPDFFSEKRPAAVLKHGILSRYLPVFARKTGSRSYLGRVAYIDGYAGPGLYGDGSAGSPALAAQTAKVLVDGNGEGRIDGYFVEQDPAACTVLKQYLADNGLNWPVFEGDVHDHLEMIAQGINPNIAFFAFLDPFGLGVKMDVLRDELLARGGRMQWGLRTDGAATEVLLNFSYSGLRRTAGHLTSTSTNPRYAKARSTFVARLDATLGGDWWQEIWRSGDLDREEQIRVGYVKRITQLEGSWSVYSVPVSNGIDDKPLYSLLFMSQHLDGPWEFNQALSSAHEEHRTACFAASGEFDYEPLEDREAEWCDEIEARVRKLAELQKPFTIVANIRDVYGNALGLAREKHVRKVIRKLYKEGVIANDPTGAKLGRFKVQPVRR